MRSPCGPLRVGVGSSGVLPAGTVKYYSSGDLLSRTGTSGSITGGALNPTPLSLLAIAGWESGTREKERGYRHLRVPSRWRLSVDGLPRPWHSSGQALAAAHTMSNPSNQPQQLSQCDTSSGTAATIGPWDSDESLRHPQSSGGNQQAAVLASSSTSFAQDPGSWCESVETPISRVRPAKQVCIWQDVV